MPALSALIAAIWLSASALGNPIGPPRPPDTTFLVPKGAVGLVMVFVINLSVNVTLFSFFLWVSGRNRADGIGQQYSNGLTFLLAVLGVSAFITAIGAFVDVAWVMTGHYTLTRSPSYWIPWLEGDGSVYHVIRFQPLLWSAALVVIFFSVQLPTVAAFRTGFRWASIIGGAICAVNAVWWILAGIFGLDILFLTLIASFLSAPVILWALVTWRSQSLISLDAKNHIAESFRATSQMPMLHTDTKVGPRKES